MKLHFFLPIAASTALILFAANRSVTRLADVAIKNEPLMVPVKVSPVKIPHDLKGTLVIAGAILDQSVGKKTGKFPVAWVNCGGGQASYKNSELPPAYSPDQYQSVKNPVFVHDKLFLHYVLNDQAETGLSSTFDFKIDKGTNKREAVAVSKFPIGPDNLAHLKMLSLTDGHLVAFSEDAYTAGNSALKVSKDGEVEKISQSYLSDRFSTSNADEIFFAQQDTSNKYPVLHKWSRDGGGKSLRISGYGPEVSPDGKYIAYFAPPSGVDKTLQDPITTLKHALYIYGPDLSRTKITDLIKNFPELAWRKNKKSELLILSNSYSYSSKTASGEIKTYDPESKTSSKAVRVTETGLANLDNPRLLKPEFTLCGIANDKYVILQVNAMEKQSRKKKFLAVDLNTGQRFDLAEVSSDDRSQVANAAWIDG